MNYELNLFKELITFFFMDTLGKICLSVQHQNCTLFLLIFAISKWSQNLVGAKKTLREKFKHAKINTILYTKTIKILNVWNCN